MYFMQDFIFELTNFLERRCFQLAWPQSVKWNDNEVTDWELSLGKREKRDFFPLNVNRSELRKFYMSRIFDRYVSFE